MIELLFTTSDYKFSRLARWALGSDCSHFAIAMDKGIVFHSNFSGVHIEPYSVFMATSTVVHSLKFKMPLRVSQEEKIYQNLIALNYGKRYDIGGMLFLGLNFIAKKIFNLPLSKKNLWIDKDYYFCTEVLGSLLELDFGTFTFPKIENITMKKPHDIFLELSSLPFLTSGSSPKSPLAEAQVSSKPSDT